MLVGYARVSTLEQTLDLQRDALDRAGCERVFTDTISGSKAERPGLEQALHFLRSDDTLVVWRLDRLGRSLQHLIETVGQLQERGVGFRSLTESIDTTSSGGKLIFHVFGALAEFERELIRERTRAGLEAARARGRKGGRPRLLERRKVAMARALHADKSNSIEDICKTLRVSRSTLYRYLEVPAVGIDNLSRRVRNRLERMRYSGYERLHLACLLQGFSLSSRDHLTRRVALPSLPTQLPRCRRASVRAGSHGQIRDGAAMVS